MLSGIQLLAGVLMQVDSSPCRRCMPFDTLVCSVQGYGGMQQGQISQDDGCIIM